jgi:hypothetical protein
MRLPGDDSGEFRPVVCFDNVIKLYRFRCQSYSAATASALLLVVKVQQVRSPQTLWLFACPRVAVVLRCTGRANLLDFMLANQHVNQALA